MKRYVIELPDEFDESRIVVPVKFADDDVPIAFGAIPRPLDDELKEAEQHGAEQAISLVKELFRIVPEKDLFDGNYVEDILNLYTLDAIRETLEKWKKKSVDVKAGDMVWWNRSMGIPGDWMGAIVLDSCDADIAWIFTENWCVEQVGKKQLRKWGENNDEIIEALKKAVKCDGFPS